MKSKAAIAFERGAPLRIEMIDVAPPQEGEVLIEVKAAGLCHSDMHAIDGHWDFNCGFPGLMGHEGAGVVLEVGPGVTRVKPGDHVVPFIPECGVCACCRSGRTNNCEASFVDSSLTSRFSFNGRNIHPFLGLGLFSQYSVVRDFTLVPVRQDAPFEKLFYFGCGATTGLSSALFKADVQPGSSVIVFGLGGIGLNVVQGARIAGATNIIAVDINPAREDIARKMGATQFVNSRTVEGDLVGYLNELTRGGADYTFEAIGNVNLMRQAYDTAHFAYGVCTIIGIAPDADMLSLPPTTLITGRQLQGAAMGGARGVEHIPRLIDLMMSGKLDIDSLITGHLPLEQINEGYAMQKRGEGIRSYVTF